MSVVPSTVNSTVTVIGSLRHRRVARCLTGKYCYFSIFLRCCFVPWDASLGLFFWVSNKSHYDNHFIVLAAIEVSTGYQSLTVKRIRGVLLTKSICLPFFINILIVLIHNYTVFVIFMCMCLCEVAIGRDMIFHRCFVGHMMHLPNPNCCLLY